MNLQHLSLENALIKSGIENYKKQIKATQKLISQTKVKDALLIQQNLNESLLKRLESLVSENYNSTKLGRLIVDWLVRHDYLETASLLITSDSLDGLVDVDSIKQANNIKKDISNHDLSSLIYWLQENKQSLSKINSRLEFDARIQVFIEYCKTRDLNAALDYMKKYIVSFTLFNKEIQQAMALIAFPASTDVKIYKDLYNDDRYNVLAAQFQSDYYKLTNQLQTPLLNTTLSLGLSSLKTSSCSNSQNRNCPTCIFPLSEIAKPLAMAQHVNSSIVCGISGKVIGDENWAVVLPNGNVYSRDGVDGVKDKDGFFMCVRSGSVFHVDQLRRAFFV